MGTGFNSGPHGVTSLWGDLRGLRPALPKKCGTQYQHLLGVADQATT